MANILGFIGAGNMAGAMIGGAIQSGRYQPEEIIVAAPTDKNLRHLQDGYGVLITNDNIKAAQAADILVLAVKPYLILQVAGQVKDFLKPGVVVISVAAGVTLAQLQAVLGGATLIRAMPNTPSLVLAGMTALFPGAGAGERDINLATELFSSFGLVEVLDEKLIDAVGAVSGSSPAYVFLFIEAMADGAVKGGMPRNLAYRFAAQAVLGAAKMVLETGEHPGKLKDMVCSPSGTTIEAIKTLEEKGLRGAVIDAMDSCMNRSRQMKNES